jgi:hypothetical protein
MQHMPFSWTDCCSIHIFLFESSLSHYSISDNSVQVRSEGHKVSCNMFTSILGIRMHGKVERKIRIAKYWPRANKLQYLEPIVSFATVQSKLVRSWLPISNRSINSPSKRRDIGYPRVVVTAGKTVWYFCLPTWNCALVHKRVSAILNTLI